MKNPNRPVKGSIIKVEPIKNIEAIDKIKKLLSDNPRNLALFIIGINSNLRVGELLNIRMNQVKNIQPDSEISVESTNSEKSKSIFLNKTCTQSVQNLIHYKQNVLGSAFSSEKFLFSGRRGPLSLPIVNNLIKRWCQSVNLKGNYGGLTLRKTYGYFQRIHSGKSLSELMTLFNHSTKKQIIDYLCLSPEECLEPATENNSRLPCRNCEELKQRIYFLEKTSMEPLKFDDAWPTNETKFEKAQQVANLGVWEVDVKLGKMFWSDELYKIYKRPKELGPLLDDWEEYIHPDDRNNVIKNIEEAFLRNKNYNVDHRIITMNGEERYIQAKGEIVNDEEGNLTRIIGTVIDITRRKKSEKALLESKKNLRKLVKANIDELKSTNNRLQQEIAFRIKTEELLRGSEEKLRTVLENAVDIIYLIDLISMTYSYISPSSIKLLGYTPEELVSLGFEKIGSMIHSDDYKKVNRLYDLKTLKTLTKGSFTTEYRIKHKTLGYQWMSDTFTILYNSNGDPESLVGNMRNITSQKKAEEELKIIHDKLEGKVKRKTAKLEDMNTVLRVLLEKRNEDKRVLEERMISNIKDLIIPYLKKIKKGKLDHNQRTYLKMLESNLNDTITPFVSEITGKYSNMTPTEIQIARLIRKGKTTKEIADLLNLSARTVEFHRDNIRKKFGIKNKKTNLRTFLLNI